MARELTLYAPFYLFSSAWMVLLE